MTRGVKGSGVKAARPVVLRDDTSPRPSRIGFIRTLSPMKQQNGQRSTTLTINQHVYKFLPNQLGDYVCEVPFADDFASILSIGAGYQPYESPQAVPTKRVRVEQPPTVREAPMVVAEPKPQRGPAKPNRLIHTPAQTAPAVDPAVG